MTIKKTELNFENRLNQVWNEEQSLVLWESGCEVRSSLQTSVVQQLESLPQQLERLPLFNCSNIWFAGDRACLQIANKIEVLRAISLPLQPGESSFKEFHHLKD
ncbi:hypothetical protein SLEP1_g58383 [Rubroshorea leprosula]|uniref:Uncharacterized protein n=1 Tax=Rubroshorea leprosula TaxID=152421 RepID=A0AAV5MP41_9ROSI|nr:hypothetical protein SLEP1_g58383 [Rubroshorea leprosula]